MRSVIALSAGFIAGANAFWRMECPGRVGLGRLDPIVNPGEFSNHVHSISGSSGFYGNVTCPELQAGTCTSCRVKQDISSYWHPALYFNHASGDYELVEQTGGMLATPWGTRPSLIRTSLPGPGWDRRPSPPSPNAPSASTVSTTVELPRLLSVVTFCPTRAFLTQTAPTASALKSFSLPAGRGKGHIDSQNHMDHVAFPDLVMSGSCPSSHPVRLPSLLYEVIWNTNAFMGKQGKFVLSNGDETGFGYHADFMMGWEEEFLQNAVQTCTKESGRIKDCPLFDLLTKEKAEECSMEKPLPHELLHENVKGPMPKLPGGGGHGHGSGTTPKYSSPHKDSGEKAVAPAYSPPGEVFKEAPAPAADAVQLAEVAAEPTLAPAPPAAGAKKFYSTQYVTHSNVVSKILLEAQTVYAIEYVESTKTIVARATDATHYRRRRAAHLHAHGHRKRKL